MHMIICVCIHIQLREYVLHIQWSLISEVNRNNNKCCFWVVIHCSLVIEVFCISETGPHCIHTFLRACRDKKSTIKEGNTIKQVSCTHYIDKCGWPIGGGRPQLKSSDNVGVLYLVIIITDPRV